MIKTTTTRTIKNYNYYIYLRIKRTFTHTHTRKDQLILTFFFLGIAVGLNKGRKTTAKEVAPKFHTEKVLNPKELFSLDQSSKKLLVWLHTKED